MSPAAPVVYVVDDDISVRESLELMIVSAGWQPQTFASAQEFLSCPRIFAPSCLILDVNLPDLNGLDLQKRIAVDHTDMPIIFLTGYGDVPMTVRAMKAGAVEFLTKPFSDDVMLSAIRQAIERSAASLHDATELHELQHRYASLSSREREVMALVVSGLLNKQVGGRTRHQRDHCEGAPRPGHAEDAGWLFCRSGAHERETVFDAGVTGLTVHRPPPG